jgi:large subunit ribosomal protein L6
VSRIGKKPLTIPDKVQVNFNGGVMAAKGPKGELSINIPEGIAFNVDNKVITFSRDNDQKDIRALHGLTRALAFNVIEGVTNGFTKTLQMEGVGYKVEMRGQRILLNLGFSHTILVIPPDGITFETPNATTIKISGIDKQLIGSVAAKIRKIRPPEPYKGKGVRYEGEYIRRKAGKTASK